MSTKNYVCIYQLFCNFFFKYRIYWLKKKTKKKQTKNYRRKKVREKMIYPHRKFFMTVPIPEKNLLKVLHLFYVVFIN